ncbi:DUF1731 domain-containing protein [Odoribacter lunatus]|uniref:DUF1731 domain-containing protein n=1 Tax=Odoribacter lunatus TaxID=2941335 RepID=UPI00203C6D0E|nr:DUF1731 domain-containing protein [Odoribacter lunatus]
MNVFVTGLHGFVGSKVKAEFERGGHKVFPVLREDLLLGGERLDRIAKWADVVVNLAGEAVTGKWTENKMIDILESRRVSTRNLVDSLNRCSKRLKLFINASAVGIYQANRFCDEDSLDIGSHFLAKVANAWEEELNKLEGARKVVLRLGLVIASNGGILKRLIPWIKGRVAFVLGSGDQECPIIHVEDVTGFMMYLLKHQELEGVYNMVIPNSVNFREFVKALTARKGLVIRVKIPEWLLCLIVGNASTVLTRSAHVIPWRVMESGYEYKCRTVREVIEELKS